MSGEFNFIFNNVNGELVYKATDSTFNDIDNTIMQLGPDVQNMDFNSLNEILGAK